MFCYNFFATPMIVIKDLSTVVLKFRNTVGEFNKWYKFNDTSVEKFEMTEEALEIECFGGDYKVPQPEGSKFIVHSMFR